MIMRKEDFNEFVATIVTGVVAIGLFGTGIWVGLLLILCTLGTTGTCPIEPLS